MSKDDYITIKIKRKTYDELTKNNILEDGSKERTISVLIDRLIRVNKECNSKVKK